MRRRNLHRVVGAMLAAGCGIHAAAASAAEAASPWKISGGVGIRVEYLDWNPGRQGTLEFDNFKFGFSYDDGKLLAAGRERYYHYSTRQDGADRGTSLLMSEYLWAGYRFGDKSEVHVGQSLVPFGILRFASSNYWESMAYYAGFEDTYAAGLKYTRKDGGLSTMLGFYPSDGGHLLGYGGTMSVLDGYDSIRYSNHLMSTYGRKEKNTFVGRLAYNFETGAGSSEVGLSVLGGRVAATDPSLSSGNRRATALHYSGAWGPVGVKLETISYRYSFSGNGSIAGNWYGACDKDCVIIGAYGFTNRMAARGNIDVVGLSYKIPGSIGPFTNFRIYNDWSRLRKSAQGYAGSSSNVLGVEFGGGPWWIMVDYSHSNNMPYLSPVFGSALAAGGSSGPTSGNRFNTSISFGF